MFYLFADEGHPNIQHLILNHEINCGYVETIYCHCMTWVECLGQNILGKYGEELQ